MIPVICIYNMAYKLLMITATTPNYLNNFAQFNEGNFLTPQ